MGYGLLELVANEVRIIVRAAGFDFANTIVIYGEYQVKLSLPFSLG